jgi:hypothetical protein
MVGLRIGGRMNIPVIELLAHIGLNKEPGSDQMRAPKKAVKQSLRRMFEPCLGSRAAYAIEHLIVAAKTLDLVREDGEYLIAVIKPKESETCPTE